MSRTSWVSAVVVGAVFSALFWIDALFIPLALLGPLVTGVTLRARSASLRWGLVAWAVAGIGAVVSDFVVNQEDVLFHVVLTLLMLGVVAAGWALAAGTSRLRSSAT